MLRTSFYYLILLFISCASLRADDITPQQPWWVKLQHPDSRMKSDYQGRTFDPGGGSYAKTYKTDDYAGVKEFESKSFVTKAFDGAKKSWMGQIFFHEKKLPENLQGANKDATKTFASKDIPLKNYGDLDKKSGFSTKENFATREIILKGKDQEAIDNNQHLQEAVKKGLSIDDVRKLLNKAP